VEAAAAGVRRSQVYYANTLDVQMVERYGQLTVRHAESGVPLPAVYVKVYARINGKDKFFKDGYTDLRGRFDYVSLNSNEIEQAEKLSVLIMSDTLGAVVREALPPAKVR
jgi:5-hydroxyisourate hydrolase-like protein (transthyretin family)